MLAISMNLFIDSIAFYAAGSKHAFNIGFSKESRLGRFYSSVWLYVIEDTLRVSIFSIELLSDELRILLFILIFSVVFLWYSNFSRSYFYLFW